MHRVNNFSQLELSTPEVELVALDEEFKKGERWLSAILIDCGHVQVINENDHFLAYCLGPVTLDRFLFDVFLNDVLEVEGGSLGREVDVQE